MNKQIKTGRETLLKEDTSALKNLVEKDCWIALRQYFEGAGNGPEAKIACVVLSTLAREKQAANNRRQLDIIENRLAIEQPQLEGK